MNKAICNRLILLSFLCLYIQEINSQPYLNILDTRVAYSPDKGLFRQKYPAITLSYFSVGASAPIQFKKKSATLIFSPTYERWNIAMTTDTRVEGIIMPLSFLKQFSGEKFSLLATVITRWNRELGHSVGNSQQWGGFVLGSFKKKDHITYKLGLYYNHELFGEFFVPLLGIDWKINEKNNLFGVLPGNMVYEHSVSKVLYYGAAFRTFTNSYRLHQADPCTGNCDAKRYIRIDENQLGLFADYYFSKRIVLNIEAGHSVFRKIREGAKDGKGTDYKMVLTEKDNFYGRAMLAYRLRFR